MHLSARTRAVVAILAASMLAMLFAFVAPTEASAASTPKLPVKYSSVDGIAKAMSDGPGAPPAGANDWSCKPSPEHPRPVILVHATLASMGVNWGTLSPLLKNEGYCVFAFNYGDNGAPVLGHLGGYTSLASSAGQLSAFVDQVTAATGVSKVDLVGHSQGGTMPRHYIKNMGGDAKVANMIGLAPPNHGTTFWGMTKMMSLFPGYAVQIGNICGACTDQMAGSPFITALNAGGETVPGVNYTVITTRYDEIVTPYSSAFLAPAPNVRNYTVQDFCWLDFSEHLAVAFDHVALRLVLNALDPANAKRPSCSYVAPIIGG